MPKSFKTVEIMQDCEHGFTREVCQRILDGWKVVKDYAWILHDKDLKADGTPKRAHLHCMIRFNDSVPTEAILARVKAITGKDDVIKYEHLGKCHKWKSAIAYLTHENVLGKYVYPREDVVSNYEFETDIEDALSDKIRLNNLLEGIGNGTIKDYNVFKHCTVQEYAQWKSKIDSAFSYRAKILMSRGDRDMKCVYIQGDSGTGKTSYAKEFCESKEYSYFVSSGSNDVLDGYGGQDAIILDDLRPSALSLADLLKMLDNNTSSSVKSRYRNKVLECRLIVITTTLDINDFFKQVFTEQPETAKQLRRRCETLIKMEKDCMRIGVYIKEADSYSFTPKMPNPIAVKYGLTKERTKDILAESLREMFGELQGLDEALQKWDIGNSDDGFVEVESIKDVPWE